MPPMGLSDTQIADVLSYVRSNFGNQAKDVKGGVVKAAREATSNRTTFWTAEELLKK